MTTTVRSLKIATVCAVLLLPAVSARGGVLEGLWKFEENAGTQKAMDSSSNGLTGTYASGALTDYGGAPGYGLGADFAASNGVVDLGTVSGFSGLTNDFSVEAWVNVDSTSTRSRVVANSSWGFGVNTGGGLILTTFGVKDYLGASGMVTAGKWTHVAAVMDSSNTVTFYVDGNPAGTVTHTAPGNATTSTTYIGGRGTGAGESFVGGIDEVAVFAGTLTQAEIQSHMSPGVPNPKGPVFRYDYASSETLPAIPDDSTAGNGATAQAGAVLSGTTVPRDLALYPLGTGDRSLGTSGGGASTNSTNLVNNANIAAAGGFTLEDWVYRTADTNASSVEKVIDMGGVYRLQVSPSADTIQFNMNGATAPLPAGEWHHVAAVFDAQGNAVDGSGNLAGVSRLFVDGQQVGGDQAYTLPASYDTSYLQTRPIGVGRHPVGGEQFQGLHYDSRVTLGALAPGEFLASAQREVFHYDYDSSEAGLTFIPDDSSAVRNARFNGAVYSGSTPNQVALMPRAIGSGDRSLDTRAGGAATMENGLLNTLQIGLAGGFTMETWLYRLTDTDGSGLEKIIDVGGVYRIQVSPSADTVALNYNSANAPLPVGEWHHVAAVFDTQGNLPNSVGDLAGVTRFFFDGEQIGSDQARTLANSDFNYYAGLRPIGLGMHPLGGERFQGLLYDTRLVLGALGPDEFLTGVPEPQALVLLAMGGLGMAGLVRRKRRRGAPS